TSLTAPAGSPLSTGQPVPATCLTGCHRDDISPLSLVEVLLCLRGPGTSSGTGVGPGFQNHHPRLLRAPRCISIDVVAHVLPPGPQALAFLTHRGASAHHTVPILELHGRIWMGLQVEPPGGLRLGPAVHRECD